MSNINIIMLIFFERVSDKHKDDLDYILSIFILRKMFNGTLSTCNRFILKIFFYGVKRMYMQESF